MLNNRHSFLFILTFILMWLASSLTYATTIPITGMSKQNISTFDLRFVSLLQQWHIPGATVAIIKNGEIYVNRGYGWSSLYPQIKMHPNTLFRIASISKTLTSVAILKLVQEHRLQLDESAFDILNDITPLKGGMIHSKLYAITIRDLLNMSSGWYTEGPGHSDPMFGPWSLHAIAQLNGNIPPTCIDATRFMMKHPLEFKPGTQFSYSNLNYCMLGLIISKVTQNNYSKTSYETFIKNNILIPAHMFHTQLGSTSFYAHNKYETHYFNMNPIHLNIDGLPYSNSQIIEKNYADGGWISSSLDLASFLQTLASYNILTKSMINSMLSKPAFVTKPDHYFTMGWSVRQVKGHRYFSKHGSFTGTTALIMQSDNGTSYVALFNAEPPGKVQFFRQVQRLFLIY